MAGAPARGGLLRLAATATAAATPRAAPGVSHAATAAAAAQHGLAAAAGLRGATGSGCGGGGGGGGRGGSGGPSGWRRRASGSTRRVGRWVAAGGSVSGTPAGAAGRLTASWGPPLGGRRGLASSLPAAASASPAAAAAAAASAAAGGGGEGVLGRAVTTGPAAGMGGVADPPPPPPPPAPASDGGFGDPAGAHPQVDGAVWPTATIADADAAAAAASPPHAGATLPAGVDMATPAATAADAADAADAVAAAAPGVVDYLLLPIKATLETAHTMTGLPWWATIALTTLAVRTLLLPVSLRVNRRAHRARLLQPRIKELQAAVMQAAESGDRTAQAARQATMMAFMNKHGVSPVGTLKDMAVQMPIFLGFFATINRLVAANAPGLSTEGALWFVDLTVRDAFYGLPLLTGLTTAVMVGAGGDGANAMAPAARKGMMAIGLLIVPLSAYFPAALFCYWLPSNLVSLAMAMALKRPAVRSAAGFDLPPGATADGRAGGGATVLVSPAEAAATYLRRKGGGEAALTPGRPVVLLKAPPVAGRRRPSPGGGGDAAPARRP